MDYVMKKTFPEVVYLNGEWLRQEHATISVFDRGFIFGDGLYEVIPFYSGKFFLKDAHLNRLRYGLNQVHIDFDVSRLEPVLEEAVTKVKLGEQDGAVYIQITRGVAPRTHYYPENVTPTILVYAFPVALKGFDKRFVDVLITEDYRWHRCDIKATSLIANVAMNDEAIKNGFHETILHRQGVITEGSHSSIFFVVNNEVYTHPEGHYILPGITRKAVIDLCKKLDVVIHEDPLKIDQLSEVDEVFLTGTTTQILGVKSMIMNGEVCFKKQEAGEITKRLQHAFIALTAQ
ncbi:D-alanine transaminase [Zhouia amylolytica]|uniref:D-alanine transaminase n=2 Tax=Zhouia amylolytica TaxID=376730 RepID=A0A1I6SM24_9FLAO|nr:D-alanine transaminase [Zhouia amylolytica]